MSTPSSGNGAVGLLVDHRIDSLSSICAERSTSEERCRRWQTSLIRIEVGQCGVARREDLQGPDQARTCGKVWMCLLCYALICALLLLVKPKKVTFEQEEQYVAISPVTPLLDMQCLRN